MLEKTYAPLSVSLLKIKIERFLVALLASGFSKEVIYPAQVSFRHLYLLLNEKNAIFLFYFFLEHVPSKTTNCIGTAFLIIPFPSAMDLV